MNPAELRKFVKPELLSGIEVCGDINRILDSGKISKPEIGAIVRHRYPQTTNLLDAKYLSAAIACAEYPSEESSARFKKMVGLIGAYNYVRGMSVIRKDGSIDREVAPRFKLNPSASIQVLEMAGVSGEDRVLEIFSGTGYFSMFLGLMQPKALDCVDLKTPAAYDLKTTFAGAYDYIFGDLDEDLRPPITKPHVIQRSAAKLSPFGGSSGFQEHYNKVFLHPPYGRESRKFFKMSEGYAFCLWLESLASLSKANGEGYTAYSIVPAEWTQLLREVGAHHETVEKGMDYLYVLLKGNPYYRQETPKKPKLKIPHWETLIDSAKDHVVIPVGETRMFPLDILIHRR